MELLQIRSELDRALAVHRRIKPRRVLEIGCWDGGTLRVWLSAKPPPEIVVAVSLEHRQPEVYPKWVHPKTELVVGTGDSVSEVMVGLIREHAPYDWAFIDGNHDESAVRHDVKVVEPLIREGGAMLLHDITPGTVDGTDGPSIVFKELQANHRTEVFDVPERFTWSAGIGVVYL